jgi:hypothetical protein
MQETMEANRQLYSEEHIRKLAKEEFSRQEVKYSGVDYASIFTGNKMFCLMIISTIFVFRLQSL